MKKISSFLFSMPLMGVLLVIFAISMGWATFIERDYGTPAARQVVYAAKWFEILLLIMVINLFGNILINKMYSRHKLTIFTFHVSFIVIILGAAITRYFGYEGLMHIRENSLSNEIQTEKTYIHIESQVNGSQKYLSKEANMTPLTPKNFKARTQLGGDVLTIKSTEYIPNASESVKTVENGIPVLKMVFADDHGRHEVLLRKGEIKNIGGILTCFGSRPQEAELHITQLPEGLYFIAKNDVALTNMMAGTTETIPKNTESELLLRVVYNINGKNLVVSEFNPSAEVVLSQGDDKNLPNAVKLELNYKGASHTTVLYGSRGVPGIPVETLVNGHLVKLAYGPGKFRIPFALKLNDFKLERYPGSNSPSSYASFLTLIDPDNKVNEEIEISMNNILRYQGYRFYQSSYDQDEMGTVLSVNKDLAGTTVTYIGYLLLTIGMIMSVINRKTRLRKLASASKTILIIGLFSVSGLTVRAQDTVHHGHEHHDNPIIPIEHAQLIDGLLVQDNKGRIKPFNTMSSEIMRKIYRGDTYNGLHANQVFLGMMVHPAFWQQQPMIKISDPELKKILNIDGKYAAFIDFFRTQDGRSEYILANRVENAFQKKPGMRDKFDNELIKADERLNISYLVYTGYLFRVLPVAGMENNKWLSFPEISESKQINDTVQLRSIIPVYFNQVDHALRTGHWESANEMAGLIEDYQRKIGTEVVPARKKVEMEVLYNELDIFDRLSGYFGILGIVFLIILFMAEIQPKYTFKKAYKFLTILTLLLFVVQTAGLALRWYVSGHAPWSNGYESMIYISWATVLAGIIFSRQSLFALASTSILASILLMVAHLSWLDPEITNLVPVLKSYWLTIHVSVITSSYGFFGLAALLGLINLLFMIFKNPENAPRLNGSVIRLSGVGEMTIIIGIYLLTIGTFLGGVWANESWGRYWGWDPKETWALITIIVYAFIAHMRFIPGLKNYFTFNFLALIAYGSVIMTYFGVNYYLAGLHSYAKGDPIPLPVWVYYSIGIIAIISILASIKNRAVNRI
jgi:cytochrome c-type biogenesis protein CcsB